VLKILLSFKLGLIIASSAWKTGVLCTLACIFHDSFLFFVNQMMQGASE